MKYFITCKAYPGKETIVEGDLDDVVNKVFDMIVNSKKRVSVSDFTVEDENGEYMAIRYSQENQAWD